MSSVTPLKTLCFRTTSVPTHLIPLNHTLPIPYVKVHTTTKLPPASKESLYFQINGKISQDAKCFKSRIITGVIDSILSIVTFEQQCVVLICMLKSPRLKDHTKNIGIEHKCMNNIKTIYQHDSKCDYQQKFKDILETDMVSTTEEITNDSPSLPMTKTTVKKRSARKSLCLSTKIFNVKKRTDICLVGDAKLKCRSVKYGFGL